MAQGLHFFYLKFHDFSGIFKNFQVFLERILRQPLSLLESIYL